MESLAILERISFRLGAFKSRKKQPTGIGKLLDSRLISFLEVDTRDEAIHTLIDLLDQNGKLPDPEQFQRAIFHREELVSTGIGMGVAIPHAKMKELKNFFIAVGIQRKKGIDWNALDGIPVRMIFMIGGPDDKQSEYLQILSQLTSMIKNVELRKALLKAEDPEQVIQLFTSF